MEAKTCLLQYALLAFHIKLIFNPFTGLSNQTKQYVEWQRQEVSGNHQCYYQRQEDENDGLLAFLSR